MNRPKITTSGKCWGEKHYYPPVKWPQPTKIDAATPKEVKERRESRIEELRRNIKRHKEQIAAAEAEIEEWESL